MRIGRITVNRNSIGCQPIPARDRFIQSAENGLAVGALLLMVMLPGLELGLRTMTGSGIAGSGGYVQVLTLWVGFVGAGIAARNKRHLRMSLAIHRLIPNHPTQIQFLVTAGSAAVTAGLLWSSLQFVWSERQGSEQIGGWLPIWLAVGVLPVGFAVVICRLDRDAPPRRAALATMVGIIVAAIAGFGFGDLASDLLWPGLALLLCLGMLGAPIFVVLGGAALLLFFADGVPVGAVSVSAYRIALSPLIPTIPLFTLVGYLLSEGRAPNRLNRVFAAWTGWLPGGDIVAVVVLCGFFASFTGASGIAIIALGGLLLPILLPRGYPPSFARGLITASGSIGLLFPPSIAIILYATMTHVPITEMFLAGLAPGLMMMLAVASYGVWTARRAGAPRQPFDWRVAVVALWDAKWELFVPVIILFGVFGGFGTLIEAAGVTVLYVLIVQTLIHRDLDIVTDVPRLLVECVQLIGGVFIILAVAFGLANYLVDAEIPTTVARSMAAHIDSRLVFLLLLNVALLTIGCLMDIYSAIIVVVPLILPMSQIFGIHPVHLGIIFLANLELGYMTPPVGLNLYLSAFRFNEPIARICRDTFPFLLVLLLAVLTITYVPTLTMGLIEP